MPVRISITVNGEPREVPEGLNVASLLEVLEIPSDRVAVELNREIVRKPEWAATPIGAGASLEIVHFVGGGRQKSIFLF